MSRVSVYENLKTAIKYRGFPYHHFEDLYCTIAFESWEQFTPFDRFLDEIAFIDDLKLNIYAEGVDDRSDGVAVTVSDEVQHLGYWDTYFDMKGKVAVWEEFLSRLYRIDVDPVAYSYYCFTLELSMADYHKVKSPLKNGELLSVPYYISEYDNKKVIHLSFPDWQ